MTITLSREEVLGIVAQKIQNTYGVTPDKIDLIEIYADGSGEASLQAKVVVRAESA